MESKESKVSRLDQCRADIRREFADELEERYTKPHEGYKVTAEDIETIRSGGKIYPGEVGTIHTVVWLGQKYRLNPDEIDVLLEELIDSDKE